MKKLEITTETYKYEDDCYIDIVTTPEKYEAWIYNGLYRVKDFMFGCPKEQQSYEEFVKCVEVNVENYIDGYRERVKDK